MSADLDAKRIALIGHLRRLRRVVVAYSGGVDSAFLAAVAHETLGPDSVAATAVSPSLARRERDEARALAARRGWRHLEIPTNEVDRDEYARNAPDRCYWCKTELFDVLQPVAASLGARVVVGTNLDDLGDYRPGLTAARERDAVAPLADAGLTKSDVRALSHELGLPTADKPASPCLASRFAYGVRVTEEGLARVEAAEEHLRSLGFSVLRVRDHGDVARVEVPAGEIERAASFAAEITAGLRAAGYRYVALDLAGFRSGALNEVLAPPTIKPR